MEFSDGSPFPMSNELALQHRTLEEPPHQHKLNMILCQATAGGKQGKFQHISIRDYANVNLNCFVNPWDPWNTLNKKKKITSLSVFGTVLVIASSMNLAIDIFWSFCFSPAWFQLHEADSCWSMDHWCRMLCSESSIQGQHWTIPNIDFNLWQIVRKIFLSIIHVNLYTLTAHI